jgi:hypothetical protein
MMEAIQVSTNDNGLVLKICNLLLQPSRLTVSEMYLLIFSLSPAGLREMPSWVCALQPYSRPPRAFPFPSQRRWQTLSLSWNEKAVVNSACSCSSGNLFLPLLPTQYREDNTADKVQKRGVARPGAVTALDKDLVTVTQVSGGSSSWPLGGLDPTVRTTPQPLLSSAQTANHVISYIISLLYLA